MTTNDAARDELLAVLDPALSVPDMAEWERSDRRRKALAQADRLLAAGYHNAKAREFCRACRDERDEIVPAEFIVWGKLTAPEHLGPRCYSHTADAIGHASMIRIDQWAVFDLRPFAAAESRGDGEPTDG